MAKVVAEQTGSGLVYFSALHSLVDEGFWHRLSSLKLNQLGIDESPIPITGFYAPCSHAMISNNLTLLSESFPSENGGQSATGLGNRNRCAVPGTLFNTNTLEGFYGLDKRSLLKAEAKKVWDDICCGAVEKDCSLLSRFLLISFADLKKWRFHYWFASPAMVLDPPARLPTLTPASKWFSVEQAESVSAACNDWRNSSKTADVPFFILRIESNSLATIMHLSEWEACKHDVDKLLFGFYDPSHHLNKPGWPLRNFLAFLHSRWNLSSIRFFCYRETRGFPDMGLSLVGVAEIPIQQGLKDGPKAVGWERDNDKAAPKCVTLANSMDPIMLSISAADLNLKLMRWRALPSLDLSILSPLKCLLLGAGTLGCEVARLLMAWGIRKITLVDSGRVAMSNPLRQSLYGFEDCLNGGEYKAVAAEKSLKRIHPAAEAKGIVMNIPMPGHPVPTHEENKVLDSCRQLHDLVDSHDVIFLLTDTRESRWLPTLLCSNSNKIAITSALGFDSFLMTRHGAGPLSSTNEDAKALSSSMANLSVDDQIAQQRLGCYFCNDVVAPVDSMSNRTLDQQCTVTRPGLAPMASALAVELLVGILHHPLGIYAPGEVSSSNGITNSEQPLGLLPHQIRGSLYHCSQMTLIGQASKCCTACSSTVVTEYRNRGTEFLLQAINHPTYLEDLTGLTELMKSARLIGLKDGPKAVGWERDNDKAAPKCVTLANSMDPIMLSISAADLNLKLMRWRALPSLDLSILSPLKCLLLGAGTLGCEVARLLMAWGIRKITLVDNGRVAMSNPLRQSLYGFEDCLNGGEYKAVAAEKSLKCIHPAAEAKGIVMNIPMPGHPVPAHEENKVLDSCRQLHDLVDSHDVIFLLTDTRESRWLPTLLCSNSNKIAITSALGFDSFLVTRHGAGPLSSTSEGAKALSSSMANLSVDDQIARQRLGCYFCNDVVAPVDSMSNRTLDQQCTVTRPGLAPMASALAVELLVGILHHPLRIYAPGEVSSSNGITNSEQPLGLLPHQIRGSLYHCSQMTLIGQASKCCTACSSTVVTEYRNRGTEFLLQAINHPTYLEDLTGLTELMKSASAFALDWDDATADETDNEEFVEI